MTRFLFLSYTLFLLSGIAPLRAQEFEYPVRHRHLLKDCHGLLKIHADGVEYTTEHAKDRRKWKFGEIRTFEVKSPTEISLVTYEDQKRWAGKDKVFEFTLLDKKATSELSAFLLTKVSRPMKLALIPENLEKPVFEIPVKHLRTISGTTGVLKIYGDTVVYETSAPRDSRYWRIKDIQRFGHPDRFRFQIVSYVPQAGGPTESYNFQLFEDLPEGVYEYLWTRLHPSTYYPAAQ